MEAKENSNEIKTNVGEITSSINKPSEKPIISLEQNMISTKENEVETQIDDSSVSKNIQNSTFTGESLNNPVKSNLIKLFKLSITRFIHLFMYIHIIICI